jgi:hypothetical protein
MVKTMNSEPTTAIVPDEVLVAAAAIVHHYLRDAEEDFFGNRDKPLHIYHDLQQLSDWLHGQFKREAALFAVGGPKVAARRVSERIFDLLKNCARQWPRTIPAFFVEDTLRHVAGRALKLYGLHVHVGGRRQNGERTR